MANRRVQPGLAGLLAAPLLMVAAGCSTGQVADGAQQAPLTSVPGWAAQLPSPASLALRRSTISTQSLQGDQYDTLDLPPQRCAAVGVDDAQFSPHWLSASQSGCGDLAYALYVFPWDGAGLSAALDLGWKSEPPADACWIGLVDYELERWDWQACPAGGWIEFGEHNRSALIGEDPSGVVVPVMVVVVGSTPVVLDEITLETYSPAQFSLLSDPPALGEGTAQAPYVWDNKLTMLLGVFDPDAWLEVAAAPETTWLVEPAAAGQFDDLDLHEVFHLAAGYTGAFRIWALYQGHPTWPDWLYFSAVDTGPADNLVPIAALDAEPVYGAPPLTVSFDGRGSYDPDGLLGIFRWDFDGDGSFDDTSNQRQVDHVYSADGSFEAILEVEDAAGATSRATAQITVNSAPAQWHLVQVRQASAGERSEVGRSSSLCVVDGKPAIAFTELDEGPGNGALYYVAAADATGAGWGEPVLVDSAVGDAAGYIYLQLRAIAGRPAVAYSPMPRYLRADDATGSSWTGPPHAVDAGAGGGWYIRMIELGGVPALLCFDDDSTDGDKGLLWIKGTDAAGSSFAAPQVLDTSQGHSELSSVGEYCSLALIGGMPAATYMARHVQWSEGNEVRYIRAADAAGDSWNAPQTAHQTGGMATGYHTALLELSDGLPGVFYQDYSATQVMYNFRRGTADGVSWGAEQTVAADSDSNNWVQAASPLLIDGGPVMGCILQNGIPAVQCHVTYVRGLDPAGDSWESQQTVADIGDSLLLSGCAIGDWPAFSYYSATEDALYFAVYY